MADKMTACSQCGHELEIGEYPFCPHFSIYSQHAQRFDPIVVHRNSDGTYSFPASIDTPARPGQERIEIRTLREADRITREVNSHEDAAIRQQHYVTEAQREQTRSRNRQQLDAAKERFSPQGREFAAKMREYVNSKQRRGPGSANFHMDVFANDSSNREAHADRQTDWKSRRG